MRLKILGLLLLLPLIAPAAPPPGIPDGWSSSYVYGNGIRIHYYRATPAPGKPVMVMVHGVTDIGLHWKILTSKLQDDYDVYMLDTRGHGLSDPFTSSDDGDTLVKDVVAFLETMKIEKPILMGHSMGAATVMRLGAEHPDLARAIIMLDPGLGRRTPPPTSGERAAGGGAPPAPPPPPRSVAPDRLVVSMRGTPEVLVAQNNYPFDDLVATCRRQSPKWSLESCQYWALSKKQYHGPYTDQTWQAMSGTVRIEGALAKIQVPALILKADVPAETRKIHEEIASVMPNGRLVHIEGGGHNLHHDEPERTLQVLHEFLSTL
ncbi:MAG TPA: alpha/beta hydrolase [Candidatus Synoicihabitans sp.]|nr:alpha/beta hydrolase [Candidatus Synoicihabitans sp.]